MWNFSRRHTLSTDGVSLAIGIEEKPLEQKSEETHPVPPIGRGGSRRPHNHTIQQPRQKPTNTANPRIVCKYSGMWEVGKINEDEEYETVEIIEEVKKLCDFIEDELISFRIYSVDNKDHQGYYQKSSAGTRGQYIIFAPEEWQHTHKQDRHEGSIYPNYRVHRFWLPDDLPRGLRKDDNREYIFEKQNNYRFTFEGNRLRESDVKHALFFGELPNFNDSKNWDNVTEIIVREEKPSGLRTSYDPRESSLSDILSNRCAGWFSALVYDSSQKLLDSFDFRFIRNIEDIESTIYRLPVSDGQVTAEIIFKGACNISSKDGIEIEEEGAYKKVTIADRQLLENLCFTIEDGGDNVEIEFDADPIMWNLGEENIVPNDWCDKLNVLNRIRFHRAASEECLWLKIPDTLRGRDVKITGGFENLRRSESCIENNKKFLYFRFGDFCDDPAVSISIDEEKFRIVLANKGCDEESIAFKILSDTPVSRPDEVEISKEIQVIANKLKSKITRGRIKVMVRNQICRERKRGKLDCEDLVAYRRNLKEYYYRLYYDNRS